MNENNAKNYLSNRLIFKPKSLKFSGDFAKIIASSFYSFNGRKSVKEKKEENCAVKGERERMAYVGLNATQARKQKRREERNILRKFYFSILLKSNPNLYIIN